MTESCRHNVYLTPKEWSMLGRAAERLTVLYGKHHSRSDVLRLMLMLWEPDIIREKTASPTYFR